MVVDQVERVVRDHPRLDIAEVAAIAARNPDFRRMNRSLRKTRWMFGEDLPEVQVAEHVRAGRRIRRHTRLVGYQHLVGISTATRPRRVTELFARIVTR